MFQNTQQLTINNKEVKNIILEDGGVFYQNSNIVKSNTVIDIDMGLSDLEYGDNFNITGLLMDENYNPIQSATVKLIVGSTVIDSQNTDNYGTVEFTYCPMRTGTHTFQLIFEGNYLYNNCASSTIYKVAKKETTYLSLSNQNTITIYENDTYHVTGRLLDNDFTPHPIANKTISVSQNNNVITSFTTNSNGEFSGNLSYFNLGGFGEHTITFSFAGDDNYSASTLQQTVIIEETHLSISANKSILSYANEDYVTITVTMHSSQPKGYMIFLSNNLDNNSITMTDNNDGTYSYIYHSTGIGDIEFHAQTGFIQSPSITIEDCLYSRIASSTDNIISPATDNCIIEYEVNPSDQWNWHYLTIYDNEGNGQSIATLSTSYDNSSSSPIKTTHFPAQNSWTPIQVTIENNTVTVSSNGVTKGTATISLSDINKIQISNSKSSTQQRNVKIKSINSSNNN